MPEGEAPSFEDYIVEKELAPSSVILFRASDQYIVDRVKNMTQQEQEVGGDSKDGYNETELKKRLKTYHQANDAEDGTPSLMDFFKERGIGNLTISIEETGRDLALQQVKVFVERVQNVPQE